MVARGERHEVESTLDRHVDDCGDAVNETLTENDAVSFNTKERIVAHEP